MMSKFVATFVTSRLNFVYFVFSLFFLLRHSTQLKLYSFEISPKFDKLILCTTFMRFEIEALLC